MADDISKFKGLDYMAKRVVRDSMSGNKNNPDAGDFFVTTAAPSDTTTPKNYMIQSEATSSTEVTVPNSVFTNGSDVVICSGSGFQTVSVGDYIRPAGVGGSFYVISQKVNNARVVLATNFDSPTGASSINGSAEVQFLKFGKAKVYSYADTDGTVFSYDNNTGSWQLGPNSALGKGGPHGTTSAGTAVLMRDGINLHSLNNGKSLPPDINIDGVISKNLPVASSDKLTEIFTPVPNPSVLTGDSTNSRITVKAKVPGSPFTLLGYKDRYLMSFTNNPLYDGYLPLPSQATMASIHLIDDFTYDEVAGPSFNGVIMPSDKGMPINNIWGPSVTVKTAGTTLTPDKDFSVDSLPGVVTLHGHTVEEEMVSAIMYNKGRIYSGLEIKAAVVSLDSASESVFTNAPVLQEKVDYTINTENGTLYLIKEADPSKTLRIEYLTQGSTKSTKIKIEAANDLRFDAFPVMPGTVTLTATIAKSDGSITLMEGKDYQIYYTTGVIRLMGEYANKIESLTASYAPALKIVVYASASDQSSFTFRVKDIPVYAIDKKTLALAYVNETLKVKSITRHDNVAIKTEGLVYTPNGKIILSGEDKVMAKVGYALVSFEITSSALPYSPMVRLYKDLEAGSLELVLENVTVSSTGILTGSILKLFNTYDPSQFEYARVQSVTDLDGVNVKVAFTQPVQKRVANLSWMLSDGVIPFGSTTLTVEAIPAGSDILTIQGTVPCRAGFFLEVVRKGTYYVTSVDYSQEGVTLARIQPKIEKTSPSQTAILSENPVYEEGDNALIADNPILPSGYPMVTLNPPTSTSVPTRYEVSLGETLKVVKKTESDPDVSMEFTLGTKTVKAILDEVVTSFPGVTYTAVGGYPLLKVYAQDLMGIAQGVNPQQLPFTFRAYTTLLRKRGGSTYSALKRGTDYSVEGGGFIVVTSPHTMGDRYKLTYHYPSRFGMSTQDSVEVKGKRLAGIPKGAQFKVMYDYKATDQFYIGTSSEIDFLDTWVTPYVEARQKAMEGPKPQGSAGIADSSSTPTGTVNSNLALLRDLYLANNTQWKVSEYYKNRMTPFSKEHFALQGLRAGNDDPTNSRMSSWLDASHQALYGESVFYPAGYSDNSPKADDRYSLSYKAYDTVWVYNDSTNGYLLGPHSNFLDTARDLKAGYKIVLGKDTTEYTVQQVVSNTVVKLTGKITGASTTVPDISSVKSFYGISYKVIRTVEGAMTYVDDRGHAGAKATSGVSDDVFVVPAISSTFKFKHSVDEGVTWVNHSIDLTSSMTIPLPMYWSLKEIASAIYDSVYQDFIVSVETIYQWVERSSETQKALSLEWPLQKPDGGGLDGRRSTICIRARASGTWIKFNETGNLDLGFSKTTTFKGASRLLSCEGWAEKEKTFRNTDILKVNPVLAVQDKIGRGATGYVNSLKPPANDVVAGVTGHIGLLKEAQQGATPILGETGATAAVTQSYTEATVALGKYSLYISESETEKTKDTAYKNGLTSTTDAAYTCDFITDVVPHNIASSESSVSYLAGAGAVFNLSSTLRQSIYDPRVVYGDRTKNPTIPLGANRALVAVYPKYVNNPSYIGTFTEYPFGNWKNLTTTSRYSSGITEPFKMDTAFTITSLVPNVYVTTTTYTITIYLGSTPTVVSYVDYPTLGALVTKLNTLGTITCAIGTYIGSTAYGTLTIMTNASIPQGSPRVIPFGIKGDIAFFTVSDYILQGRVTQDTLRNTRLNEYIGWYPSRAAQIRASFGSTGESLASNRQQWVSSLMHKIYGTVTAYLPLKKVLKEVFDER